MDHVPTALPSDAALLRGRAELPLPQVARRKWWSKERFALGLREMSLRMALGHGGKSLGSLVVRFLISLGVSSRMVRFLSFPIRNQVVQCFLSYIPINHPGGECVTLSEHFLHFFECSPRRLGEAEKYVDTCRKVECTKDKVRFVCN